MSPIDWIIVALLNLVVFGYGGWRALKTRSDVDWFLGGRALPFWVVGISMFATSVDGGEYIALNGATYKDGLSMMVGIGFGIGVGGMIAGFLVVPKIFRASHYTNAEYLEARFGLSVRLISVLVQIQYRTSVLGTIIVALHLTLTEVASLQPHHAWMLIGALALLTAGYAAFGGLRTVAATDLLLGATMFIATFVLFLSIWNVVGGWTGLEAKLVQQEGASTAHKLLHIGTASPSGVHPIVVILGWCLIATGYFVVNHTQTMKMLSVGRMWDMQMSVVVGVGLIMLSSYFSSTIGLFGRALMPGLEDPDLIYPRLVRTYLYPGFMGIVVAGVLASAISTFEGIGTALAALFTRDVYARVLVTNADDRHYLTVSRISTLVVVAAGFLYVPAILAADGIVSFFVRITSVFVTPLMTVYILGATLPVRRHSGLVGIVVGATYGLSALFLGGSVEQPGILPYWFTEKFAAFIWSFSITAASMLLASWMIPESNTKGKAKVSGWLASSSAAITNRTEQEESHPLWQQPLLWATLVMAAAGTMVFVVLW